MSPVMPTVRHCPLLPGESIFAGSRAESGNYIAACPKNAAAIRLFFCLAHFCDSLPIPTESLSFQPARQTDLRPFIHKSAINLEW